MATRPLAAFEEFRQALELTTAQRNTISARRDTIRGYIAADWIISSAIFGGSYARDTKIRPRPGSRSDVDIFLVLHGRYRRDYAGGTIRSNLASCSMTSSERSTRNWRPARRKGRRKAASLVLERDKSA